MRFLLARGVVVVAVGLGFRALGSDAPGMIPAAAPVVQYEGRCVAEPDGSVRMGFPGVTAHLRFQGRTLSLRARASGKLYLDVLVDGGAPRQVLLGPGDASYDIVEGASASVHTVEIVRCNESWQGACAFLGFDAGPGGSFLQPAALPGRKLMFIGDSVTCGAMTAWVPGRDFQDPENSNARLTFGSILARHFGAQYHLVSYGGRGIIRDWEGNREDRNAPQFYELALPDDPTVPWRHEAYVPDAIGIQLGTNDFSRGIPDQNEFVNTYVEFVRKVRRDAPHALIFLMDSPILWDDPAGPPKRSVLRAYLNEILGKVGDPRVILAPLSHYPGVPGNGHPTGADHEAMARELEPLLQKGIGW